MKYIEFGHGYRLRRVDANNWELQQWHTPDPDHPGTKSTEPRWKGMGRYYQTLTGAVCAVYELVLRDGDETCDLLQAMERAEGIRADLMEATKGVRLG